MEISRSFGFRYRFGCMIGCQFEFRLSVSPRKSRKKRLAKFMYLEPMIDMDWKRDGNTRYCISKNPVYRVFSCDCNKKNLYSTENLSFSCSFNLEQFEELLDVLFGTIVNFAFVILLPLKFLFLKLPHCQFPKSGQILKIFFEENPK